MIILGWIGVADAVSETQVGDLLDLIFQGSGILLSIYGNYKAHREIKAMGGYR